MRAHRTRTAIRAAALRLARERGYEATTVDDVAAQAGVSRRTVFNYFPTKPDLFVRGPHAPCPEQIDAFVSSRGDLLEDLVRLISDADSHMHDDAEEFRTLRRILRDNPALLPELDSRVRVFHSAVRAAIARRLDADLADPRVVGASALASAMVRSAVDLWSGCEEDLAADRDGGPRRARPASVPEAVALIAQGLREALLDSGPIDEEQS